ncbi:MAG TPA: hypothetical protein VIY48_10445 [Candidatus Paceibacterota bacterium]
MTVFYPTNVFSLVLTFLTGIAVIVVVALVLYGLGLVASWVVAAIFPGGLG